MRFAEAILSALSRYPEAEDPVHARHAWTIANALDHISGVFPDFRNRITEQRVLDFGSGMGYQVVAMAKSGARRAVGIESHPEGRAHSIALAAQAGAGDRTGFAERLPEEWAGQFDIVISQNSMEHYPDPVSILVEMRRALTENGQLFIAFGPPWHAPWGAHMRFFYRRAVGESVVRGTHGHGGTQLLPARRGAVLRGSRVRSQSDVSCQVRADRQGCGPDMGISALRVREGNKYSCKDSVGARIGCQPD